MLFREVYDAVLDTLRSSSWLDATRDVTIIRALDGTVRLFVETASGRTRPTEADRLGLEADLRARIGPWLGGQQPVWIAPKDGKHAALIAAIHAARKERQAQPATAFRLFRVERHAARHGWVGELKYQPPWAVADADAGRRPPIVSFFSHKGGVGRTTALAATAIHLAEWGNQVLVVDLDLEAPGLGTLLADPAPTEPGLLDLLVGPEAVMAAQLGTVVTPLAADLLVSGPPVLVVKAGEVDEGYLDLLARVDLHGSADVQRFTERLSRVLEALTDAHRPDIVLLDARAGFHDVGGIALGALSHGAVFLGLSNEQSFQGLRRVAEVLSENGYDDDDEPKVWLEVVHALAAPSGGDDAHFVERAGDVLREWYYVEGSVPQDVPVFALPFREALRGAGDRLTPRVVDSLREAPWRRLAARVAAKYAHLRWQVEDGHDTG